MLYGKVLKVVVIRFSRCLIQRAVLWCQVLSSSAEVSIDAAFSELVLLHGSLLAGHRAAQTGQAAGVGWRKTGRVRVCDLCGKFGAGEERQQQSRLNTNDAE